MIVIRLELVFFFVFVLFCFSGLESHTISFFVFEMCDHGLVWPSILIFYCLWFFFTLV